MLYATVVHNLDVIVGSFVGPIAMYLANLVMRWGEGPQSRGADALLVLMAFDVAVLSSVDSFRPLLASPELGKQLVPLHTGLLVAGFVLWMFVVKAERRATIGIAGDPESKQQSFWAWMRTFGLYLLSWFFVLGMFVFHFVEFAIKVPK
jgi:hypothetical protein